MSKQRTTESFIELARQRHGDLYDYSKVAYVDSETPIWIGCREHGLFLQRPHIHSQGSGCQLCGNKLKLGQKALSLDEMIIRAKEVHGPDQYDYSLIENYTKQKNKHKIKCNKCGRTFEQSLYKHVNRKQGCPNCALSGFSAALDGYVYLLESESMFKVGITNRNISNRVREVNKDCPEKFKLLLSVATSGDVCRTLEEALINEYLKHFNKVSETFHGSTECFYKKDDFDFVKKVFLDFSSTVDTLTTFVPKSRRKPKGIPRDIAKTRKKLGEKRGVPVGVQYTQNIWRFYINIRLNEQKKRYKVVTLGTFDTKEDCVEFAQHYWDTGEILNTTKNRMYYKKDGFPVGLSIRSKYFKVSWGYQTRQFKDIDDALFYLNILKVQYG